MSTPGFAERALAWWHAHGRKDLPWQRRPTPYRVWVSEIMLQQTQVATVIPYFRRFVGRFPGVRALAKADLDEVLALWSGLGYYARARNLHRAARVVLDAHGGRFPRDVDALASLPGIGRSTAGAIASLALGKRHPILDGNVKRVLSRHAGVEGWPSETTVSRALWAIAESRLPASGCAAYTQAMMDLGATLCTARAPRCDACPVRDDCVAHASGRVAAIPAPRPRRALPERAVTFVIGRDARGRVLLERRPSAGVWGGLWGLPECPAPDDAPGVLSRLDLAPAAPPRALSTLRHGFTHFRLAITPLLFDVRPARGTRAADTDALRWVAPRGRTDIGLAAPVSRLLASLADHDEEDFG